MRLAIQLAGVTHREVAKRTDTNATNLSRYVNGHIVPSADYLARFVVVTGSDGHWLLTGDGTPHRMDEDEATRLLSAVLRAMAPDAGALGRLLATVKAEPTPPRAPKQRPRPRRRR